MNSKVITLTFSKDGKLLLSGETNGISGEIRVWDLSTKKLSNCFKVHEYNSITEILDLSDELCAVIGETGGGMLSESFIRVFNKQTGQLFKEYTVKNRWTDIVMTYHYISGDREGLKVLAITATLDGKLLFAATNLFHVAIFDTTSGECIRRLGVESSDDALPLPFDGHFSAVTALSVTPDGRWLVTGGKDGDIRKWDLTNYNCVQRIKSNSGGVNEVLITSDGKRAISLGVDRIIKIWDLIEGKLTGEITQTSAMIKLIEKSERTSILSISEKNQNVLEIWDLKNRELVKTLENTKSIETITADSYGSLGAIASTNDSISIWKISGDESHLMYELVDDKIITDVQSNATETSEPTSLLSTDGTKSKKQSKWRNLFKRHQRLLLSLSFYFLN